VKNENYDPSKGLFYSFGGALLLSTNFITVKYGLRGFNPETFSLVWTASAAIYALVIALLAKKSREQLFPKRNAIAILAIGVCTAVGMILAWKGLSTLDPAFASFLWRILPVLTVLAGVIVLKERLYRAELLAMIVMLLGGLLSVVGRWHIVGTGVVLTVLAGIAGALQLMIAKITVNDVHPNVLVAYRVAIGAMLIACWTFATGAADFSVEARYWGVTLLGAFLGPCASFLLTFRAYKCWSLSKSSLILMAQPLLVLPMAYVFLDTVPQLKELTGGGIILSGGLWFALIQVKKNKRGLHRSKSKFS